MTASAGARVLVVLLELCERLAGPRPLYADVAASLGVTGLDHRIPAPNAAGPPADDALAHAIVVADPASGITREVELWPAAEAQVTPALLRAALGRPERVPRAFVAPGEDSPLLHLVTRRDRTLQVVAAAADDRVTRILVRR